MKSKIYLLSLIFALFISTSANALLDEGMWMLDAINKLPLNEMKKTGLELTPEQIYNPNGTSLKDAVVLLGGGTGSFVSPNGLILTNHHVAYGAIVSVSSVMEDRLKNGFLANKYEEEIQIDNMTAQVLISMKEITEEVLAEIKDDMTAADRQKAINAKLREIERREKGNSDFECRATDVYNGVKYYLFTFEIIKDIRLVYAPPNSIGNYGSEIDNWVWPRHTGDFSFLRAYVSPEGKTVKFSKDNVPYKPKHFFPISTKGFDEGSYQMIMGFPGRTFRYRTAADIKVAFEEALPTTVDLFRTRIEIINKWSKKDRAIELKYANRVRGLENTYKKSLGVLEGMKRINLLQMKEAEEADFLKFINSNPELNNRYGNLLSEIDKLTNEMLQDNKKRMMLMNLQSTDLYRLAQRLMSFTAVPARDSLGKIIQRTDTDRAPIKNFFDAVYKNYLPEVDKELFTALLMKAADLPSEQSFEVVQKIVKGKTGDKRERAIRKFVDDLYCDTDLRTKEKAEKLLKEDDDDIRDDEFVEFAIALDKDDAVMKDRYAKYETQIGLLRTKLMEAYMKWKGENLYPDANRTMRFTYGTVKTLRPRDAVNLDYVTTLGGVMEKETGSEPFDVPAKLRQLWEKKDFGIYTDKKSGDVPVAFISNLDITGGNSGSPILNGKGELTGCAFDGNWEGVVGDYHFEDAMNRTISVDSRYILFILDKFSGAQNLLNEMLIK